MIEVTNLTAQTLQPGQALVFDRTVLRTRNGCECHSDQTPETVKLCCKGIYSVSFSGNISGDAAATAVQLSIALGGTAIPTSVMNSVSVAANDVNNVATRIPVRICCGDLTRLSVINSGTTPVTVAANSAFTIIRES